VGQANDRGCVMTEMTRSEGPTAARVRAALRERLVARGHVVESDTLGPRGGLYITGSGDLAAALFEFKNSAHEVVDTMYQGAWIDVPPASSTGEGAFELLEQMRIIRLLYVVDGDTVEFVDLGDVLSRKLQA